MNVGNDRNGRLVGERDCRVRYAFLGAAETEDFRFAVDIDVKAALHVVGDGLSKPLSPSEWRIPVGARVGVCGADRGDNLWWRWLIRIAHAEVDEVGSFGACGGF